MKFIARHLNLIGLLMLAAFGAAAAGLYFQKPNHTPVVKAKSAAAIAGFVCPMHPKVTSVTQSDCSECGMKLVAIRDGKPEAGEAHADGCCGKKAVAEQAPVAMSCPHLAAQTAQASSCCPKPANP